MINMYQALGPRDLAVKVWEGSGALSVFQLGGLQVTQVLCLFPGVQTLVQVPTVGHPHGRTLVCNQFNSYAPHG